MRLTLRRHAAQAREPAEELLEAVTPRTNAAVITPAEHLCGALALGDDLDTAAAVAPVSLEIAGDHLGRRFLARAASAAERRDLVGQIGAAYPQATLRPAAAEEDPARMRRGEQLAVCTLVLRYPLPAAAHLPRRRGRRRLLRSGGSGNRTSTPAAIMVVTAAVARGLTLGFTPSGHPDLGRMAGRL